MSNLANVAGETNNKPDSGPSRIAPPIASGADVTPGQGKNVSSEVDAKLQVIFDGVETGIFLIDPETHQILDANPLALNLIGAERGQVLGAVCHKFVCPAERERCPFTDLNQKLDNSERVLLTATGNRIPIIKTVRQVTISGRKLLLESFFDISERKRAEETLRESEDRYRDLVENSFVLISTHDSQGRFLSLNGATARVLEAANADEVIGRSLADYIPPKLQPQFEKYLATILSEGHAEGRMVIAAPSGKVKVVEYQNTLRTHGLNEPIIRCVGQDVTDRIEAEKAQAFLASCMESSQDAIIGVDLKGNIISWNRGAHDLYGYSTEEALGKCISILTPPERLAELSHLLENARRGNAVSNLETERVGKDGQRHDISLAITSVCNKEGILTGSASIGRDITKRKRDEQALATERDLLGALMDNHPDFIYFKDRQSRFVRANQALAKSFGVRSPAAMAGKTDFDFFTAEHAQQAYNDEQEVIRTGIAIVAKEEKETRPDGHATWVSTTKLPLHDSVGKIVGTFGVSRDITERKRTEEQTRLQTAALESAANGIAITDLEGRAIWVNPAFTSLTGYSTAEIIGQTMRLLKSGEHAHDFYETMWSTILSGQVWQGQIVNRRKDGTLYTDFTTITPVPDSEGRFTHFVAVKQDATGRHRAQQALEERTAYLNTLVEISPYGVVVVNTDGLIQMSNSAFERLFRYSREEMLGANLDELIVPADLASEAKFLTGLCLNGPGACLTTCRRRKDGALVDVDINGVPIVIKGELRGVLALYQDISERKRAEADLVRYAEDLEVSKSVQEDHAQKLARLVEELAQERDLLGTLMDNIPDAIYYKDREGKLLRGNLALAKALGLKDPREAVGKSDFDFYPEEDAREYARNELQVIESGQAHSGQMTKVRQPDGEYRWRLTSNAPIRDMQGRVTGLVGIARDMTDRLQAEETLRASEERYRELFENASDIVYTTGLDTRITSLNRVGQQVLGYSAAEAMQLDLRDLVAPKHWNLVQRGRERIQAGERDVTLEVEVKSKDGRTMMLEVKPRLIVRGGKPAGIQGIGRNITGRDEAEMELRHAQKLESVGRLASGIAHEINTPIQFVGDNTRFLQDSFGCFQTLLAHYQKLREAAELGVVTPELVEKLRAIEEDTDSAYLLDEIPKALAQTLEGVSRVATIVRAMKEFAHPEGKEMAAADLNKAILSTLTVARNEVKYVADVETEFGNLPLVVCNIGDLNQVFLNLLVNAAHAIGGVVSGSGKKGKIRVTTVAEGSTVLLTISDTGCGIPEGNRAKVFDPFFTTKEVGRGTGQGLAIARSVVVDRHKGSLTFDTEIGKGTTFYIRLPVDPAQTPREANGV